MDNSRKNTIKNIAQELDCGNNCYYNPNTDEIVTIPNFAQIADEDEFRYAFSAKIDKVTKNKTEFMKIEVLESFESFKIMERFVSQIADKQLKWNWKLF